MIGPIRQELLSGIRSKEHFTALKAHLSAFPDLQIETKVYEKAAEFHNRNRSRGVQGSNTDFLICAVSMLYQMPILTTDKDVLAFQQHIDIRLHLPRAIS